MWHLVHGSSWDSRELSLRPNLNQCLNLRMSPNKFNIIYIVVYCLWIISAIHRWQGGARVLPTRYRVTAGSYTKLQDSGNLNGLLPGSVRDPQPSQYADSSSYKWTKQGLLSSDHVCWCKSEKTESPRGFHSRVYRSPLREGWRRVLWPHTCEVSLVLQQSERKSLCRSTRQ